MSKEQIMKSEEAQPVAWMHTIHMELEQKRSIFTPIKENPFGVAGKNYPESYQVTSEPLYTHPAHQAVRKMPRLTDYEIEKLQHGDITCWNWDDTKIFSKSIMDAMEAKAKTDDDSVQKLVGALEFADAALKAIRWLRKPGGVINAKDAPRLVETMEVLAGEPISAIKAALDAVRSVK